MAIAQRLVVLESDDQPAATSGQVRALPPVTKAGPFDSSAQAASSGSSSILGASWRNGRDPAALGRTTIHPQASGAATEGPGDSNCYSGVGSGGGIVLGPGRMRIQSNVQSSYEHLRGEPMRLRHLS